MTSYPDPTQADHDVRQYLDQEGQATTGQIATALQLPLSTVSSTLAHATKAGQVTDSGHGHWASTVRA